MGVKEVKSELESQKLKVVIIGDGDKVIKQYPTKDTTVIENDKVYLVTNGINYTMPNMKDWSRFEVIKFCELVNLEYSFEGFGYVVSQSIKEGTKLTEKSKLDILLGNLKKVKN